jgi:hypothetical protein
VNAVIFAFWVCLLIWSTLNGSLDALLAPLAHTHSTADLPCAQPHTPLGRRVPAWNLCGR